MAGSRTEVLSSTLGSLASILDLQLHARRIAVAAEMLADNVVIRYRLSAKEIRAETVIALKDSGIEPCARTVVTLTMHAVQDVHRLQVADMICCSAA